MDKTISKDGIKESTSLVTLNIYGIKMEIGIKNRTIKSAKKGDKVAINLA